MKDIGSFSSKYILNKKGILIMILGHDSNSASKDTGSFASTQVSINSNIP